VLAITQDSTFLTFAVPSVGNSLKSGRVIEADLEELDRDAVGRVVGGEWRLDEAEKPE
jgi:hypothetical protein